MKFFKYIGIIAIVLFSFYYTERIANFVLANNDLYQEIEKNKDKYEIKSISAMIEGNYIIPGLTGLSVNIKDSYYNMKALEVFNSYYLIYNDTYPVISINQNKDKIIKQGNSNKNSIALILEYDEALINYLEGYNFSVLTTLNNFNKEVKYEQINNEVNNFKELENLIGKYAFNANICLVNNSNEKICRENNKFLVEPTHILSNTTYLELKDHINSGDIILIKKGTSPKNVDIILKSILYKDYKINYLSEHISETR